MVDVFADEPNGPIPEEEMGAADMAGFETEFLSPVIMPVATRRIRGVASIQIDWINRAEHSLTVIRLEPPLSNVIAAFRPNLTNKNRVRQTVNNISHTAASTVSVKRPRDSRTSRVATSPAQPRIRACRSAVGIPPRWAASVRSSLAAGIVLHCRPTIEIFTGRI